MSTSKMRMSIAISLVLGLLAVGPAARAKEPAAATTADTASLQALLDAVRSNRKALVATNLELTDDEAAKFWPVYDKYQGEMAAIGDRFATLLQDYAAKFTSASDDEAMKLVNDYIGLENDRVTVRRNYVPEFAKTLPGRKVARLYQIENKMDALIRYDLASTIPVIEEKGAAPK